MTIHNFKCFTDQPLTLGALTLFVGANASGKSSAIQSMLLLRQSHLRGALARGELLLNGRLANIGTIGDAFTSNPDANDDVLSFTLTDDDGKSYAFGFNYIRGETGRYSMIGPAAAYDSQ